MSLYTNMGNNHQQLVISGWVKFGVTVVLSFLSIVSFNATAESIDDTCFPLYRDAGAIPGTGLSCRITASTADVGLGNYFCTANSGIASIKRYCGSYPKEGGDCKKERGNPVNMSVGNKRQLEVDYKSFGQASLNLSRHYNSSSISAVGGEFGKHWLYGVNRKVRAKYSTANVFRPDGRIYTFKLVGADWISDADITDKLVELKNAESVRIGWMYSIDATGETETFDASGALLKVTNRLGLATNVVYSCVSADVNCLVPTSKAIAPKSGLPIQIVDTFGRSLHFTYNASSRISTMTNPQGYLYTYQYDANGNVSSVIYPDDTVKNYLYGEPAYVSSTPDSGISYSSSLTAIVDENNNRYASWRYDAKGRAISSEHANAIEKFIFNYSTLASGRPLSTKVTDSRNTERTYNFTTILGVVKITGTDQPAGSGCAASGSNITYDANGNISSKTDFNGNKTTYVYDMSRNLETSRTEGLTTAGAATAATRTITTSWHPTWRLPLTVSEYAGNSASGTALRTTTTTYDDKGNITSVTEADPVNNTSRTVTTTYTYSTAVPGLVLTKVVDGPRTDVNDITTYQYYPHDAVCEDSTATPIIDPITNSSPANLGCRGQLSSITNAAGQITSYDRYNHHGQIEQMTDANGLVTTNTYDLRQRLLSRTVGTETTTLTYDNVGQVIHLTLPDNSQLNYSYDAAHRLTDIIDNLGNRIHYTLDAQGNRINENITDPSNQLTKTVTRGYDALNRLQQVTGIE